MFTRNALYQETCHELFTCGDVGDTSLGDGSPNGPRERDLVMPDLRRCGGGAMDGFDTCFAELSDPRSVGPKRHDLLEILMIALCTVLSGGQTAVDMAVFGEAKQEFLSRFLGLRNGVPSHDTFSRVFRNSTPISSVPVFRNSWPASAKPASGVIAIDGKTLRRSLEPERARSALHMISAWCCDKRLVLARSPPSSRMRGGGTQALGILIAEGHGS